MKVISKRLYEYANRVLDMIHESDGIDKGIMIAGSWVDIDERLNMDGEQEGVAVLYSVRDIIDIDFIEEALKGYIEGRVKIPKILIAEKPENQWKKQQAVLTKTLKNFLEKQGKDKETAMIEAMYAASNFGSIKKGSGWGGSHFEDIADIAERAIRQWDSVDIRISKEGDPVYWDGHIYIEVLGTKKIDK